MEAIRLSDDLQKYLRAHEGEKGWIHSIFTDTFNVATPTGELISVMSASRDIQPMSVMVAATPREIRGLRAEETVVLNPHGLLFVESNRWLEVTGAEVWRSEMDLSGTLNPPEIQLSILKQIESALKNRDVDVGLSPLIRELGTLKGISSAGGTLENSTKTRDENATDKTIENSVEMNEYCDFIKERVIRLIRAIEVEAYDMAIEEIPHLIGFGPGLTPSSDDMLCGMMLSLRYGESLKDASIRNPEAFKFIDDIYTSCLGKTTQISEQMLKYAAGGTAAEGYRQMIRCIYFEENENIDLCIGRVLSHGASSGSDFLVGVYLMNQIRLRAYLEGNESI